MSTKRKRVSRTESSQDVFELPPHSADDENNPNVSTPTKPSALRKGVATPATGRSVKRNALDDELTTPTTKRILPIINSKFNPVTPSKFDTPRRNAADRSAKRKTTRRIVERSIAAEGSEDEGSAEEDLAQKIVGDDDDSNAKELHGGVEVGEDSNRQPGEDEAELLDAGQTPRETPVKRGRGRPKGSKNREVTPPKELPAHEWYFWINRPNGSKTSSNTFPSSALLNHSTYHDAIGKYKDPHEDSIRNLHEHHLSQFPLWEFELNMGFSVLLFGYGSKMSLLKAWADWLHNKHRLDHPGAAEAATAASKGRRKGKQAITIGNSEKRVASSAPLTIILDAYHPALVPRSLFATIADAALSYDMAAALPNQAADACAYLLSSLTSTATELAPDIYLLINPIHAPLLTHSPMPSLLADLASHPRVHLLAAADDAQTPLLWPQVLKDAYNWVFHDGTTFVSYDSSATLPVSDAGASDGEVEQRTTGSIAGAGVVDTINELLGRRGARGKGREGVRWVLRSLPENARGVYRILVTEILSAAEGGTGGVDIDLLGANDVFGSTDIDLGIDIDFGLGGGDAAEDEDGIILDDDGGGGLRRRTGGKKRQTRPRADEELPAIPYRTIYSQAVEEFLCSSEMAFRGLLKEFVDHQMVALKRDLAGQEALTIEMRRDELEGVLEDLTLAD